MKKNILSAAFILLAFSFTACKKNYVCECRWTKEVTGSFGVKNVAEKGIEFYPAGRILSKDSEEKCKGYEAVATEYGPQYPDDNQSRKTTATCKALEQ